MRRSRRAPRTTSARASSCCDAAHGGGSKVKGEPRPRAMQDSAAAARAATPPMPCAALGGHGALARRMRVAKRRSMRAV
eukprot:6913591-Prymnesium_polylepis.1